MIQNKFCENCKYYHHTANILGGIAQCMKNIKPLTTFWQNKACAKHEYTKEDKLKAQNDFYNKRLNGALQFKERRNYD